MSDTEGQTLREHPMSDYQDQLELEQMSSALGVKRYRENLRKSGEENSQVGVNLIGQVIPAIASSIEDWCTVKKGGSVRRNKTLMEFVAEFEGDYESIAYITAQACIGAVSKNKPLTACAQGLSKKLETELEYRQLDRDAPRLYKTLLRQLEKTSHEEHRRRVVMHCKNKYEITRPKWDMSHRVKLGIKLVHIFADVTGLITIENVKARGVKTKLILNATPKYEQWMRESHSNCEVLSPVYQPMVVPPRPWSDIKGGGYLNQPQFKLKLIKTRNENYIEELRHTDMPAVYGAVNTMQETAWRVNSGVYNVMKEVWEGGGHLGNLPPREDLPFPAKPHDIAENEEARTLWKREASKVRVQNIRMRSKRIGVAEKLRMAEQFMDREAIYYVWTLDWRGRAYPLASFMHPQADDSGKALLQFAEGKALGETGGYWLAVHIAGLFGVDKCSFDERVQWVQDNTEEILDSALSPLDGNRFWTRADKPWCALAACYEWAGFSISGTEYVSHLPVSMDGSCNGLQNFSAVLRDSVGGKAVNLTPSESPQDIYMEVCELVNKRLEPDSVWQGKVTRSLVKRPVMTLPYGASRFGMREQIMSEIDKIEDVAGESYLGEDVVLQEACGELASIIYTAIGDVVIAARQAMDWLQSVARIAAKEGLPIHWHSPAGLPVLQNYFETTSRRIAVSMGTQSVTVKTVEDTKAINRRRMAQGIAPNVVHSWDASHLMATINRCAEYGIDDFCMVHDSYGTHAANIEIMSRALRETFIEQYTPDILGEFRKEIIEQLPEDLAEQIPEVPESGSLDLSGVMDSEFFFA